MKLLQGDCLNHLKQLPSQSVDLVYLDPPFFTQKTHSLKTRDNTQTYEFEDKWDSILDYKNFIMIRLKECKRVMKNTASIFLHCDRTASHHLRIVLDDVFGVDNFQSEIIWSYKRWSNASKGLLNSHQNIYFYTKTKDFKFNKIYTDYSPTTNVDQILQERIRDNNGKSVYNRDKNGVIKFGTEKKGVPLSDVWDIPYLNPKAKERTGYPTQKPIILLERIISLTTDEEDVVLDPFCGSGTTLVAAQFLKRDYIGIDVSPEAIELSGNRLSNPIKSESLMMKKGILAYENKTETEQIILNCLNAIPVQRNSGIDGFLKDYYMNYPVSVKIQKPSETLIEAKSKLIQASKTKKCSLMVLIRTNHNDGIFFGDNVDYPNLLVIDSYDLIIKRCKETNIFKEIKEIQIR